ncbi:hypothetical protein C8Q79DRAFT_637777 [Trametes meyenii]|nr:hypothetical protein C8Q79DRAFT_637777 [Trametes meyenii]
MGDNLNRALPLMCGIWIITKAEAAFVVDLNPNSENEATSRSLSYIVSPEAAISEAFATTWTSYLPSSPNSRRWHRKLRLLRPFPSLGRSRLYLPRVTTPTTPQSLFYLCARPLELAWLRQVLH